MQGKAANRAAIEARTFRTLASSEHAVIDTSGRDADTVTEQILTLLAPSLPTK
jgi:hypothetical protein